MAEAKGFEPSKPLPTYTRSRRAPSTTRTRFRLGIIVAYFDEYEKVRCGRLSFWTENI